MNEEPRDARQTRPAAGVSLFGTSGPKRAQEADLLADHARAALVVPVTEPMFAPSRVWKSLTEAQISEAVLLENGLFPHSSVEPAVSAIDLLRTRLMQAMTQKGWRRIAITSPTHGCGKSFVAANLALSLARRPDGRAVLLDLDLRSPHLFDLFSLKQPVDLHEFLTGDQPLEAAFRRYGRQLALGLNSAPVRDTAQLLQDPELHKSLDHVLEQLDPDIILYDMPPMLVCDDILAIAGQVDAVLLVADGTQTSPKDIRRCEELLTDVLPIMGVVLNRSQDLGLGRYRYGKG